MPYEMNWRPLGVYTRYRGQVTETEFFQSLDDLHQHPEFALFRFSIRDLRWCKTDPVDPRGYLPFASRLLAARLANPHIYSAVIVDDPDILSIALRLKALASDMLEIFEDLDDALPWLQLMTGTPLEHLVSQEPPTRGAPLHTPPGAPGTWPARP
jgi:hypothetical protein